MNKKRILLCALISSSVWGINVQADESGYWRSTAGEIVRNNFGECWRTIDWNSSNALPECEGGKKPVQKKPVDSDRDGVVDSKDQCPRTEHGVSVDSRGCVKDSDGDGVADTNDRCPGTASGVKVDVKGCDLGRDSDGDGIADSNDACPSTAKGTVVDTRGCKLQANISLENVQFATGTANLSSNSRAILDDVASTLKKNPHLKFEVAGHTDSLGNYNRNVALSKSRASSVRQYLIDSGVSADRLTAKGYGSDKPVASNDTRSGRQKNRRVELVLK